MISKYVLFVLRDFKTFHYVFMILLGFKIQKFFLISEPY